MDIKLKGVDGSGNLRALDFVSDGDERILSLDTNATRVEIPNGSTLDIASSGTFKVSSGGTLQVDAGSTLNIQSVLTADAGAAITGAGTIDDQVIGGNTAVAGTFTTGIATTTFQSPLLDATGVSGQLKFNTLDVGLKISSGALQVKQTESDAYGGLYASGQVSGEGVYKELTIFSTLPNINSFKEELHSLGSVPRVHEFFCKLKSGQNDWGYTDEAEIPLAAVNPFVGVTLTCYVNSTNAGVGYLVDSNVATNVAPIIIVIDSGSPNYLLLNQLDNDKWELRVKLWK